MVTLDPITQVMNLIPLIIVFALSIVSMTLCHWILSASGNRFATEITSILGIGTFILGEIIVGN